MAKKTSKPKMTEAPLASEEKTIQQPESQEKINQKQTEADVKKEAEAQTAPNKEPQANIEAEAQTAPNEEPQANIEAEAQTAPNEEPQEPQANIEAEAQTAPNEEPQANIEAEAQTAPKEEPQEPQANIEAEAQTAPNEEPQEPQANMEAEAQTAPNEELITEVDGDKSAEVEEIAEAGIATQDTIKTKKDYGNIDEESIKRNKIEAALFVAARPISVEEIMAKTDLKKKEIETHLFKLAKEYQSRVTALEIVRIGDDKFSLQIKPQYTEDVKKFASGGLLKEAVMRTLTIIAAKQPIAKALVVKLRGAGAYDHVKELLQNELIVEEKKGRSSELRTTDRFADMFGLPRDINEMKRVLAKSLGIKTDKAEGQ